MPAEYVITTTTIEDITTTISDHVGHNGHTFRTYIRHGFDGRLLSTSIVDLDLAVKVYGPDHEAAESRAE